jgi:hypothetical protein
MSPYYYPPDNTPQSFGQGLLSGIINGIAQQQQYKKQATALGALGKTLDDLGNTDLGGRTTYHDPTQPGSAVYAAAAQNNPGSNTNFNYGAPTSADIGKGLLGSLAAIQPTYQQALNPQATSVTPSIGAQVLNGTGQLPAPSSGLISLAAAKQPYNYVSDANGNAIQGNDGTYTVTTPDGQQHTVMADAKADYAIDPAQNPGVYDWYKPSAQPAAQNDSLAAFKGNQVQATTTPMKTPQEAAALINREGITAMKQLYDQGIDAAQFVPWIQQFMKDQNAAYTEKYNQARIADLSQQFNASQDKYQKASLAAQMGQYGIKVDPQLLNSMSPDWKIQIMNRGNVQTPIMVDSKSGRSIDLGDYSNGMSPNTAAQLNEDRFKWTTPSANNVNDNNTKVQTTGMYNNTQLQLGTMKNRGVKINPGSTKSYQDMMQKMADMDPATRTAWVQNPTNRQMLAQYAAAAGIGVDQYKNDMEAALNGGNG